jgi:uncharacterized membrane protein YdjX (TVP38/TMEM64 family)
MAAGDETEGARGVEALDASSIPARDGASKLRILLRFLPLVGIGCVLVLGYIFGLQDLLSLSGLRQHRAELTAFVEANLPLAALAYVLVYIGIVTVSFPGAGIMTITGGFMFGAALGTVLASISAASGATLFFLIARSSFGDFFLRRAGERVQRLRRGFIEEGFSYLLFLRLVPLFPFWLINLGAALCAMPLVPYVAATAIGVVPPTFAFALFGGGLGEALESEEGIVISSKLVVALVLLSIAALAPPLVRRWRRGKGE